MIDWFVGERREPDGAFKPLTGALPSAAEAGIAVRAHKQRWCAEGPTITILPMLDDPDGAFEVYGPVDGKRGWIAEVRVMGFERMPWQDASRKVHDGQVDE